jgi:hypothetical protein
MSDLHEWNTLHLLGWTSQLRQQLIGVLLASLVLEVPLVLFLRHLLPRWLGCANLVSYLSASVLSLEMLPEDFLDDLLLAGLLHSLRVQFLCHLGCLGPLGRQ